VGGGDDTPPAASSAFGVDVDGWFFWNFKMEHAVYQEWSYLAGLKGGWLPPAMDRSALASDLFGSCSTIEEATVDDGEATV
jgi:hypothetical protein